ncbi:MAG TPA: aminotransferase class V-fold PLP-dependent enzyme [Gemmatimonadaceae bacterium]
MSTTSSPRTAPHASLADVEALRRAEFPWATRGERIYLNNASTGPLPRRTVEAIAAFTAKRAEPWRLSQEEQFAALDRGRELVARLVGARASEIALMVNTGYGINLAASALPLRRGDVVLTFDREFPANVYPWMARERDGVRLERIPCVDGLPDEQRLLEEIGRPEVRAVAISWVQFSNGWVADLAAIGRRCRERGVWLVVDGIQGVGARELDLGALDVDILACGAQKWLLSPWGTGFVRVREELVRELEPASVGWMSVRGSDDFTRLVEYDLTWREDARRFEMVTLPFQDFAGMDASLELLLELGTAAVSRRVEALTGRIVAWARGRDGVRLLTPPGRRAGIVSLVPRGEAEGASRRLEAAGVAHSLREGAIRLSPHCYNTEGEVDRALEVLAEG